MVGPQCKLYYSWGPSTKQITEAAKRVAKKYCPYYAGTEDNRCSNYEYDMEKSHFDVREVEVIE